MTEWETKNEVRWWRPRWPAVSQQSFPLLLSDRPPTPSLRGNTAAQLRDASAGGVAMWPGSGKGDVEDTSQKTRRRGEGEPPSYSPPWQAHQSARRTRPSPLVPELGPLFPCGPPPVSHAGASGLAAHTSALQWPEQAEQTFQGIILFSAMLGSICGHVAKQLGWTVYRVKARFAFLCLLTLPAWLIIASTHSSSHLLKTPAHKTRNQGKEKLRGMLTTTDWGFHDSALVLPLLLFHVRWDKLFHASYLKHELNTTCAKL